MRIRRKKHLKERLAQVKDYLIVPNRDEPNVQKAIADKRYFNYAEIFGNDNNVELEIGCGKGGFIIEKALKNPNVNFLAVELLENVLVMACEDAKEKGLKNLKFVNSGAEYMPRYIKEGSIDNIYLNFSPPFPKDGNENRRLTCTPFVLGYKSFLKDGGKIYQKTDDKGLFEYSYSKFVEHGFKVEDITEKLVHSTSDNVVTEYENKFRINGIKIYGLIATKKD